MAGFKGVRDVRPDKDRNGDDRYTHPVPESISGLLLRDLRQCGLFAEVVTPPFEPSEIDVLLAADLQRMLWRETFEWYTVPAYLMALTGFLGLLYGMVAPVSGAEGTASIEFTVEDMDGALIGRAQGSHSLKVGRTFLNMDPYDVAGPGGTEAAALEAASEDLLSNLAFLLRSSGVEERTRAIDLPSDRTGCIADIECRAPRICEAGRCIDPPTEGSPEHRP